MRLAMSARSCGSSEMRRGSIMLLVLANLCPSLSGFISPLSSTRHNARRATSVMQLPLTSTLQLVSSWKDEVVVVKYGGHAMTNDERAAEFASDVALLQSLGVRPVVVHGGGPQISAMLEKMEVESEFVNGLRKTTPAVMEVVEMVLCGSLNKKIASAVNAAGGRAVGISGKDDFLDTASQRDPELGLVGDISAESVRVPLLHSLLDAGIVPVIAPVACDADGASYNVNADTMAGAIAGALSAASLLLLTDVEGVLDGPPPEGKLLPRLTSAEAKKLTEDGVATGGMIPKLGTAMEAVGGGVGEAVIMDGRVPHCALEHLFGEADVGTAVCA